MEIILLCYENEYRNMSPWFPWVLSSPPIIDSEKKELGQGNRPMSSRTHILKSHFLYLFVYEVTYSIIFCVRIL